MLLSFTVRWGAGAAQVCHRLSVAPPLLANADQTNVPWLASALFALSLAGAAVLLSRSRCVAFCAPRVLAAHPDRSAFHLRGGFQ